MNIQYRRANGWRSAIGKTAAVSSILTFCLNPSFAAADTASPWKTWLVDSDEVVVQPPPDQASTGEELEWLKKHVENLTPEQSRNIAYWRPGAANYRWVELILQRYRKGPPSPLKSRGMALLNAAIYDAVVLASNAKNTYQRKRPSGIPMAGQIPESSSYPSAHAAAAASAAGVLSYLFPDEASTFMEHAKQASSARTDAGVNFPSDIEAGLAIGTAVSQRFVEYAQKDNSNSVFEGTRPTGPGKLKGEKFVYPTTGDWKPWVISSADEFLPPPPPAIDSVEMEQELQAIKSIERTVPAAMQGWINHSVASAYQWWYDRLAVAVFESDLEDNLLQSALAYSTVSVANQDSMIACFNAKYTYWLIRPAQLDDEVPLLFPSPPHPSYPSAHSCSSRSYAVSIAHFFDFHSASVHEIAENAGISRIIAGIHYPADKKSGDALGTAVAEQVIAHSEKMKGL